MDHLLSIYYVFQAHPLYWQVPLGILSTSGAFAWFKHKVAMQGRARITAWLSLISAATVFLHMAIIGLPAVGALGLIKLTAEQSVFYIGGLTLVYNFLKDRVAKWLQSAQAEAPDTSTTPAQKNQNSQPVSAAAAGVVPF